MTLRNFTEHYIDGIGIGMDLEPTSYIFRDQPIQAKPLASGDRLVVDGLHTYQIGSVVSHALQNDDDPVAAVAQAKANGHELVYIFGLGARISRTPKAYIRIDIGDLVRFEGNTYTIGTAPNRNLRLIPIGTAPNRNLRLIPA
jgi:hypothetical protein